MICLLMLHLENPACGIHCSLSVGYLHVKKAYQIPQDQTKARGKLHPVRAAIKSCLLIPTSELGLPQP